MSPRAVTALCALLLTLNLLCGAGGSRILGVVPTSSYSHQVTFQPLWRELSLRGHQVTVLTTNPVNDPTLVNLTEISLHMMYEIINQNAHPISHMVEAQKKGFVSLLDAHTAYFHGVIEAELQQPVVQNLIKNDTDGFDLVMVEFMHPTMFAFASRFNCPSIALTSMEAPNYAYDAVGNPYHPIANPDFFLPFVEPLTFSQRVISVGYSIYLHLYENLYVYPMENKIIRKYFGEGYPPLTDILRNISMLFINVNTIVHGVRPTVPAVVHIGGGTHMSPLRPLPMEVRKFVESEEDEGFIYFSLGSNVKSDDLPERTRRIILDAFSELPYKVLWKIEARSLDNVPKNMLISKWFPQQDVLRHPKIKLFITHGGLQSTEEAIFSHVPLIGIPFFTDQIGNVLRIVQRGLGLSVDLENIEKESFKRKITEVINNQKYRDRVIEMAELDQDQPMSGLEKAIWWTEYVLRHKGAKHLRSPTVDLPLYQYFLLDVLAYVVVCVVAAAYLVSKILKFILRLARRCLSYKKMKVL